MPPATTVRFEPEVLAKLDQLAQSLGRPRGWVIKEAVSRYLEYETWFHQAVQEGLDAVAEGDVVSHEEVKERIRKLGLNAE